MEDTELFDITESLEQLHRLARRHEGLKGLMHRIHRSLVAATTVYRDFAEERVRQDQKWGAQSHPIRDESDADFYSDQAEQWRQICDIRAAQKKQTWFHVAIEEFFEVFAESDPTLQRKELVQLGAVITHMIEQIDERQEAPHEPKTDSDSDPVSPDDGY